MKWEYKVDAWEGNRVIRVDEVEQANQDTQLHLNEHGLQGWELVEHKVGSVEGESGKLHWFGFAIWKRPLPENVSGYSPVRRRRRRHPAKRRRA